MVKVWRRLPMRQKYQKKNSCNNMFSLAHFLLRCCHTFFTSALGLLPWTATLQEWCNSEKFWKFQILIKFKFKLNIIFSEKNLKNSEKIWKFQIFRKKNGKIRKKLKISDFQKKMKNSEKIWKIQIFRKNLKISEKIKFQKKSKKFR